DFVTVTDGLVSFEAEDSFELQPDPKKQESSMGRVHHPNWREGMGCPCMISHEQGGILMLKSFVAK
ncbi:MAG: hypothetical protein RJA81_2363, partial [Planctomycetota bacterium]